MAAAIEQPRPLAGAVADPVVRDRVQLLTQPAHVTQHCRRLLRHMFSTRSSSTSPTGDIWPPHRQRHGSAGRWRGTVIGDVRNQHPAGAFPDRSPRSRHHHHRHRRDRQRSPRHAQRTRITAGPECLHHWARPTSWRAGLDIQSNADWPTTNSTGTATTYHHKTRTPVRSLATAPTWALDPLARACADCTPG